jgi:hypothetical protein
MKYQGPVPIGSSGGPTSISSRSPTILPEISLRESIMVTEKNCPWLKREDECEDRFIEIESELRADSSNPRLSFSFKIKLPVNRPLSGGQSELRAD